MIWVFNCCWSNGHFFSMMTTAKVFLEHNALTVYFYWKNFLYHWNPFISWRNIFQVTWVLPKNSVQMEPIYQKHTEPLSHPSKKVHSGWKKVNKTFKIQKWEHFNFWWPFGQFWNIVRRGLLIIQCVISALLIFRASDIFLPDRSACSWPEAISYAPPTVSRNSLTAFHIFQPWSFLKPT